MIDSQSDDDFSAGTGNEACSSKKAKAKGKAKAKANRKNKSHAIGGSSFAHENPKVMLISLKGEMRLVMEINGSLNSTFVFSRSSGIESYCCQ
jgi:hypothetical protein